MMFAVYGWVMTIGALVDESTAWKGNITIGISFTVLMFISLAIGLSKQRVMRKRFEAEIHQQFAEQGYLEAALFAERVSISLDDARDQLDRRMAERGWRREEGSGYNAVYRL